MTELYQDFTLQTFCIKTSSNNPKAIQTRVNKESFIGQVSFDKELHFNLCYIYKTKFK